MGVRQQMLPAVITEALRAPRPADDVSDQAPYTQHLAFPIYDRVPDGCILHRMPNGMHSPHLRVGEYAVVDTQDREIVEGELYLIQQISRRVVWQVVRSRFAGVDGYMLRPLNQPRSQAERLQLLDQGRQVYMSDGPIRVDALVEKIVGRVIGVHQSTAAAGCCFGG